MVAGGVAGYKTKFQNTIQLSSTEAEWVAACEAMVMYEDNHCALYMANAQQPSSRTRHIDIKTFALTEWLERDLILLKDIITTKNCAYHFTKALQKHYSISIQIHSWDDEYHYILPNKC